MAKYTTTDQVDLPVVAERYGLSQPDIVPLAGGAANSSFHLLCPSGEFVLTILDNHDTASALRLAVHTQAVFRLGVPTTEVVPSVDGSLITHINNRPVILKKWIEGVVSQPFPISMLPAAGRLLARLHALPLDSPGLSDIPVGSRRLSSNHTALIPQFQDTEFAHWLTGRLDSIRIYEAGHGRPRTLVHGDLFDDNLIVRDDGWLTVLDWETISLDDPLLDLGMAAVGLAHEGGILAPERLRLLVEGYQERGPLSKADLSALPIAIEHAALIIAFHRYYRHNVRFPNPAKREYHAEMIRFADSVKSVGQSIS